MRTQFPFIDPEETEEKGKRPILLGLPSLTSAADEPNGENDRLDPFPIPSATDARNGVVQTPSLPERVRTRMALTLSDECYYRPSASTPISSNAYYAQGMMTAPHIPPRAVEQSHRVGRHASLARGGRYGEGYDYESYGEYVNPSRARGSLAHMPSGDYGSRQSMSRMNREHNTYAYAY